MEKYQEMVVAGSSAEAVYRAAAADGLGQIELIRLIRMLFDLDLIGAKEVVVRAKGTAPSLDALQARIADELDRELGEEGTGQL